LGSPLVNTTENKDSSTAVILSHVTDVLSLLAFPGAPSHATQVQGGKVCPVCSHDISIENASAFLSFFRVYDLTRALPVICHLPVRCGVDSKDEAASFCTQVLLEIQGLNGDKSCEVSQAMYMIAQLAEFFGKSFDGEGNVLRLVLGLKHACATNAGATDAWNMCVTQIVAHERDEGCMDGNVLREIGRKLSGTYL
jgi:hypothetical protein